MPTNVASVTSHFPSAEPGFTTTTSASVASGATTVGLNSLSGYVTGEVAVFVIDPTDANKKQVFTGVVDTVGVQLTGVKWTSGTNQSHALGATVVDYATATHISMMTKGILVHADQDGTLKAGAVDNAAVLAADVVTTPKILDANVTTSKLATGIESATKERNPYKFSAHLAADITLPANFAITKINLDTEAFDTSNNFDAVTNRRFVAPIAGFYYFCGRVQFFVSNSVVCQSYIYKNGAVAKGGIYINNSTGGNSEVTCLVEGFLSLAVGDYVELFGAQNNTVVQTVRGGADRTYLDGFLVSAT